MPDKRAICSLADSIVIDYVPKNIRDIIDRNITISEDIKAVVRGMNDETLVVTNKGVYTIKKGKVNFFPYDVILEDKYVHRVYRRGRFELPLVGKGRVRLPDENKEPDFGPDPAPNVINFPWSKAELFQKAEQIISINKELHDARTSGLQAIKPEEKEHLVETVILEERNLILELMQEIKKLQGEIAQIKEEMKKEKILERQQKGR